MAHPLDDWYIKVGDKSPATQVWKTATRAYVPLSDSGYVAFLAAGNIPEVYPTEVLMFDFFNQVASQLQFGGARPGYFSKLDIVKGTSYQLTNPLASVLVVGSNSAAPVSTFEVKLPPVQTHQTVPIGFCVTVANQGSNAHGASVKTYAGADLFTSASPLAVGEFARLWLKTNYVPGGQWLIERTPSAAAVDYSGGVPGGGGE